MLFVVSYTWLWFRHQVVSNSCSPMDSTRLLCPWHSPGKNTGVGCYFVLQIFPTQETNPGLLPCRQVLYRMSYKGSPSYT